LAKKDFSTPPSNPSPLSGYFSKENNNVNEQATTDLKDKGDQTVKEKSLGVKLSQIKEKEVDKKGKLISARVNEKKWEEFKKVSKKLNYSANELLNILIEDIVSSYKK
jgi:hypothetical protein